MRYLGEIILNSEHIKKLNGDNYCTLLSLDDRLDVDLLKFKKFDFLSDKKYLKEPHIVTFSVIKSSGKYIEVIDVLAIEDETDEEIIEKGLKSQNPMIWLGVLKNAEKLYKTSELRDIILPRLHSVDKTEINLGEYIPKKLYYTYPEIRRFFLDSNRFRICTNLLRSNKSTDSYKVNTLIPEIKDIVKTGKLPIEDILKSISNEYLLMLVDVITVNDLFPYLIKDEDLEHKELNSKYIELLAEHDFDNTLLEILPKKVIYEQLFEILPIDKKIVYFVEKLIHKNIIISNTDLEYLISLLESISYDERKSLLDKLRWEIKNNRLLIKYLNTNDQLKIIYSYNNSDLMEVWNDLRYNTKVLFIYSLAKRKKDAGVLYSIKENNPIVRGLMNILWVKDYEDKKEEVFIKGNNMIQDYIVHFCWGSTLPINLGSLLPHCPDKVVMYCEGKEWNNEHSKDVFCPRKGNSCPVYYTNNKIYPNQNLDYHEWSLMELLDYSNITPSLKDLYKPKEYVNKLSGWVNRLIEIRARLKCTGCGKTLTSNKKYSRSLAAYNATVFSCNCGDPANSSVYISHCWACREIIDSREENYRLENFYLCLKCGSGNQNSKFQQGTYCPKCGSRNMKKISDINDNRDYMCHDCGHTIHIPPEYKWTGRGRQSNIEEDNFLGSNMF